MVVAPGTGYFRVDVTLSKDGKDELISKTFSTVELKPNTVNNISLNLTFESSTTNIYDFDKKYNLGHCYYSYNAAENYWNGHEWNSTDPKQPTVNGDYATPVNRQDNSPVSYDQHTQLFQSLPSCFEMAWYAYHGDAHRDDITLWTLFGKPHTGGVWVKKLDVIANDLGKSREQLKAQSPNGNDINFAIVQPVTHGKPAADKISNYFFLPAAGFYGSWQHGEELTFVQLGIYGYCWASYPKNSRLNYEEENSKTAMLWYGEDGIVMGTHYNYYGLIACPSLFK